MTPKICPGELGAGGRRRYLSGERKLRLGIYCFYRLFNVDSETTARFSHLDSQSRDQSSPCFERFAQVLIVPPRSRMTTSSLRGLQEATR
jgi:hypothetical protein